MPGAIQLTRRSNSNQPLLFQGRKHTEFTYCQLYHWITTTKQTSLHITFRLELLSPCDDFTENRPQMFHFEGGYKTPFVLGSTLRYLNSSFQSEFSVVLLNSDSIVRFFLFLQCLPEPQYFWFPKNIIKLSESSKTEHPQLTLSIYKLGL